MEAKGVQRKHGGPKARKIWSEKVGGTPRDKQNVSGYAWILMMTRGCDPFVAYPGAPGTGLLLYRGGVALALEGPPLSSRLKMEGVAKPLAPGGRYAPAGFE